MGKCSVPEQGPLSDSERSKMLESITITPTEHSALMKLNSMKRYIVKSKKSWGMNFKKKHDREVEVKPSRFVPDLCEIIEQFIAGSINDEDYPLLSQDTDTCRNESGRKATKLPTSMRK